MPTTLQMLRSYREPELVAIAELRNAFLDSAETQEQLLELLAAQLTDPESVQSAFHEVAEATLHAQEAIEELLRNGGEMPIPQFTRTYGSIRHMGTAKLERDRPWEMPDSVAELLYYHGLIGSGFAGAGPSAQSVVFIPSDVVPWLPSPAHAAPEEGLSVRPVAPPSPSCKLLADDSFLEDIGSLLGFLYTDALHLTAEGEPNATDIDRFVERLQVPIRADSEGVDSTGAASLAAADPETRLALLLHLANLLGWLRLGEDSVVELTGNRVRAFLEATRAGQRRMLWDAWCNSSEWNDLEHTPDLEFTHRNNWSNDPIQARATMLQILSNLEPEEWFSQAEVIQAIQETEPDYQRPTGEYDTWYIRSITTQEYFKGFEQWDAVEGALLRFYIQGPLHWLQAVDLAEPTAGDDYQLSLNQLGAHWLKESATVPHESEPQLLTIGDDFTVTVPYGTPLLNRFRIERFAKWQRSDPDYVYQINRRGLQRAQQQHVTSQQIVAFLRENSHSLPAHVESALTRYGADDAT